jgi:hypothetical protein
LQFLRVCETDGVLHVSAKFRTLAKIVNDPQTDVGVMAEIMQLFADFLTVTYNEMTSMCMEGFSLCLSSFLRRFHIGPTIALTQRLLFVRPHSWYHSATILRVVKGIPMDLADSLLDGTRVVRLLLDFCMSQNEKLQANAKKYLARFVCRTSFFKYTAYIASQIDFFDVATLSGYLEVLRLILVTANVTDLEHLHYAVLSISEGAKIYKWDPVLMTRVIAFFACFDLSFIPLPKLAPWFEFAIAIIIASLSSLTGVEWKTAIKPRTKARALELVEQHLSSMDYDIISDSAMDYGTFLAPFASALAFVTAVPPESVDLDVVRTLFPRVFDLFPYEASRLLHSQWHRFDDCERRDFLRTACPSLPYVQDYGPASILCGLFMTVPGAATDDGLAECRDILARIASWAADRCEPVPVLYAFLRSAGRDVDAAVGRLSLQQRQEARALSDGEAAYHPRVHRFDSGAAAVRGLSHACYAHAGVDRAALGADERYAKTQLQFSLREFAAEDLQRLLVRFADEGDCAGVLRVVRAAKARRRVLAIGRLLLPLAAIPAVVLYLVAVRSGELPALLAHLRRHENDCEIETAVRAATFREFMTDAGPVRKAELRRICQIWNRFSVGESVDRAMLFDFPIQKLAASTEKPRKLALVVVFTALLLSSVHGVPATFPATLLLNLHLFSAVLPQLVLARTLRALAERCAGTRAAGDVLSFAAAFAAACEPRSPARAVALCVAALLGGTQKVSSDQIAFFLGSRVPSFFLAGLRLFDEMLRALPDGAHAPLMRNALPLVLGGFPAFVALPGVSEAFALPVTSILLRDALRAFHGTIVAAVPGLLVPHARAPFVPLAFAIHVAIRACPRASAAFAPLCDASDALDTEPACMSLVVPALQMLRERAYKALSAREREGFVTEKVTDWFQASARFDCTAMADVIYEWAKALQDTIGFDHASSFVCYQLPKYVPRFFPVFTAMGRFVAKQGPGGDRAAAVQRLEEAALVNRCRAHALATLLLARGRGRQACELASFDRDCEESEQMIAANPTLRELLAEISESSGAKREP